MFKRPGSFLFPLSPYRCRSNVLFWCCICQRSFVLSSWLLDRLHRCHCYNRPPSFDSPPRTLLGPLWKIGSVVDDISILGISMCGWLWISIFELHVTRCIIRILLYLFGQLTSSSIFFCLAFFVDLFPSFFVFFCGMTSSANWFRDLRVISLYQFNPPPSCVLVFLVIRFFFLISYAFLSQQINCQCWYINTYRILSLCFWALSVNHNYWWAGRLRSDL